MTAALTMFWQQHLAVLPVVVPLIAAAVVLLLGDTRAARQRGVVWAVLVLLLAVAISGFMRSSAGEQPVYLVGNWRAPFGIVLVMDKLAVLMLVLVTLVGAASFAAMVRDSHTATARHFPALFLLQLMGLNGAFLTADLFNLFVFFEVLLAASYGLLLQQPDRTRTNAATHYVVINLVASALFLIAIALLYGVTGTLNMADLSQKLGGAPPFSRMLVAAGGALLVVVFGIKAALLPLNFWLTRTYSAALLPVAALFALMTKVGVIAIARTLTTLFPPESPVNVLLSGALIWVAPLTMLFAACGALAARTLAVLIGWSVVGSAGLLVTAIAIGDARALSGAIFYMVGSTLATALMFLNAESLDATRATPAVSGQSTRAWAWTGTAFLVGALTLAGLPPFSGFIGKATVLAGATAHSHRTWVFAVVLTAGFLTVLAFARMGSQLFWKRDAALMGHRAWPVWVPALALVLLTVFAAPVQRFADQAAVELRQPAMSTGGVLTKLPVSRPAEGVK